MSNDYNELKGILRHYARECDLPYGEAFADAADAIDDLQGKLSRLILNWPRSIQEPEDELLAKVGEAEILRRLMVLGEVVKGKIPLVTVKAETVEDVERAVVKIETDSRRLILDQDFGFMWYNSEGPEE